jgi:RNA polymerase sigma-70 factor (ECF subfamily)
VPPPDDGASDPAKLAAWFDQCAPALALYLRQWLDVAAADDVVQELFVKLLSQQQLPRDARAWLYRAARNAAISLGRSFWRRRRREQAVARQRSELFDTRPDDAIDAAEASKAVSRLPPEQREAVVLRIWSGLTLAEIAQVTGTSVSTAFARYRAGLTEIRGTLESSCKAMKDIAATTQTPRR